MADSTPLMSLLRALNDGGIHSTAELARRLGVSEGLVIVMADDLGRRGYLAGVGQACETACEGCGLRTMCAPHAAPTVAPRLLSLTARGRRAAAR